MKRILVATDTCKEAIMFMKDKGKIFYEKQLQFDLNRKRI